MSIFDKINLKDSQRYIRDTILPVSIDLDLKETGRYKEFTSDRNKEWIVSITVAQNFWANNVQLEHMKMPALRALAATLFEDILRELPRLRLAIESGDKEGAIEATFRIEKATQP